MSRSPQTICEREMFAKAHTPTWAAILIFLHIFVTFALFDQTSSSSKATIFSPSQSHEDFNILSTSSSTDADVCIATIQTVIKAHRIISTFRESGEKWNQINWIYYSNICEFSCSVFFFALGQAGASKNEDGKLVNWKEEKNDENVPISHFLPPYLLDAVLFYFHFPSSISSSLFFFARVMWLNLNCLRRRNWTTARKATRTENFPVINFLDKFPLLSTMSR